MFVLFGSSKPGSMIFVITYYYQRGIRVLIYLGTYDWQCNASANKLWVERLEWSGQGEYLANSWRNWTVGGKRVGETKTSGTLTVATVDGAGHMISRFSSAVTPGFV
jgi:carboxypeptidase C (cathepsin A)